MTPKKGGAGRAAAFLDLDRTLIDVDAGFSFAQYVVDSDRTRIRAAEGAERRRLIRRQRARMLEVYAKGSFLLPLYRARLVRRSRLVRASYAFFRGLALEEVRAALAVFFENELKHRVYPGVRALLAWHREREDATVIVTSAPSTVARLFAAHLGVDHAAGVHLEHVDGRLTGRVRAGPLWGAQKLAIAKRLAAEHGWDLSASYAYSDHDSDVALLEATGNPVAVHPNARLERIAARRGWPVLRLENEADVVQALVARG